MDTPPLVPMMASPTMDPSQDVYRLLLKERIVFLGSEVNDTVANLLIAQLLYLEGEDPGKDIWLYINSPGGSITAGFAIYDTMKYVKPDIATICIGQCASFAAVLLASGTKGKRYALPNSRVLIHQPWLQGLGGQASDIDIHAKDILRMRHRLNEILAEHTGQPIERIERDTDRDYILESKAAQEYGIVDQVISKRD